MAGVYLEPVGFLYGIIAKEAVDIGAALPLAGSDIAFPVARLWEGEPGKMTYATVRTSTLLSIEDDSVQALLATIVAPRSPLLGRPMNQPIIMGIVNVTPDSFSDGGQFIDADQAVAHANKLVADGASILDIGGESTRPGAETVPEDQELNRIIPALQRIASIGVPISIDTRKPEVMRGAVQAGASILNDVSGLTYAEDSLKVAVELQKPTIIMHSQGDPAIMQDKPNYLDVCVEIYDELEKRIQVAIAAGLRKDLIIIDPGIGFGKSSAHNVSILKSLSLFHGLGVPILLGVSRKSLIQDVASQTTPQQRVAGSIAAALTAISCGIQIIRVHDVFETYQAISIWDAIHNQVQAD